MVNLFLQMNSSYILKKLYFYLSRRPLNWSSDIEDIYNVLIHQ